MTLRGFTLISLLIALFLASLLLVAVIKLFTTCQQLYRVQINLAEMDQRIAVTANLLQQTLQSAGIAGCKRLVKHRLMAKADPHSQQGNPQDTLIIEHSYSLPAKLLQQVNSQQIIVATPNALWVEPKTAVISNCQHSELFKIKRQQRVTDQASQLFLVDRLQYHYQQAEIFLWQKEQWYIAKTTRVNDHHHSIYGLYLRQQPTQRAEELVSGIERWAIHYGVAVANQAIHYVKRDEVTDWERVKAIQIELLFSTLADVARQPMVYQFAGQQYKARDTKVYRNVILTISLV
ncbi:MAG: hypothetical protein Tsb005_08770 [Gammaproteobacteria bacterium]